MTPNDAPPLSEEEIAELREFMEYARGVYDFRAKETPLARFDRLVAERDALRSEVDTAPIVKELWEDGTRLLAENASLKAEVEELRRQKTTHYENWNRIELRNRELVAQVERLKADGERLDWLELGPATLGVAEFSGGPPMRTVVRGGVRQFADTFRDAIDLARKAKGGE